MNQYHSLYKQTLIFNKILQYHKQNEQQTLKEIILFQTIKYEIVNLAVDVAYVLDNNVKVLVYSGDKEFACNYVGGLVWTHDMKWSKQQESQQANFSDYIVNGQKAGQIKGAGNLHFLRVFEAGHMVSMDQPQVALQMRNEFISQN